ncbi:type II toxin-antitoxin system VapB family antitoxin [Rhizobium sp. CBN3]|uniref:antitoxin n=1 Tax=Rhizobium sp. CBN3 TaxID=3058045 RepID=UPI0026721107|nr:type II toxin-antitoxin system VapB family antitoxin [Rhizobium sp. CBN3]MDO3433352.1 type II toxin-antitoxin system VapB family antitoxin [Rhizobium sp. CBN3]
METAKIFWSGRSQAVRLPKEFRFDGDTVAIRRQGRAVILEPISDGWEWLTDVTGPVDSDFATAAEERPAQQERSGFDFCK